MSAIAGMLRFDGSPVQRRDLERAANALRMYGPDRSGVYLSENIGLAHNLMRMTPEDFLEHQPTRGPSGAIICADLRMDNRDEIARRLGLAARDFEDWPDSRLLLAAWEALGDAIWPLLRGVFAVAIWDPRTRALRLARDPLGLAPLFFYRCDRYLGFASMPKGLFAMPDAPRRLDERKIADFLVLDHTDHSTTIYDQIFRTSPGRVRIIAADGATHEIEYWSLESLPPVRRGSYADYSEGLRERLDIAVRRQLRSAHPVGCLLSGGLDSSSVTALAAAALGEQGRRLAAYTQTPPPGFSEPAPAGFYNDETPFVQEIARKLGNVDLNFIRNDEHDDFEPVDKFLLALEGPIRNPTNLGWMCGILQLARSQGRRVLLGGLLGNYTISWAGWSQAIDHVRRGRLLTAARQWMLYYRLSDLSLWSSFARLFVQPAIPRRLSMRAHLLTKRDAPWSSYSSIRPDFAEAHRVAERAHAGRHDFFHFLRPEERRWGLLGYDYLGEWAAAEKGAFGVETRDPTADLDVVAYCYGVPPQQYLAENMDRALVRRAMWGRLPPVVLSNRLRGMQAADWFEKLKRRRSTMSAQLTSAAQTSGLVRKAIDVDRLHDLLDNWPKSANETPRTRMKLQLLLSRGVHVAHFIEWFELSNAGASKSRPNA